MRKMELKKARNDAGSKTTSHKVNSDGTVSITERVVTDYGDEEEVMRVVSKEEYAAMSQNSNCGAVEILGQTSVATLGGGSQAL